MRPKPLDLEKIKEEIADEVEKFFPKGDKKRGEALALVGIIFAKFIQRIKFAYKFYLKYKDRPSLFSKEQYKIEFYTVNGEKFITNIAGKGEPYNEWLFKLAFAYKSK